MRDEKKIDIGSVIVMKVVRDNNVVSEELFQIEEFYKSFILCRHIKAGYRESFKPHDLWKAGAISWNQRNNYIKSTRFVCGG